jgi:hypothetical protein
MAGDIIADSRATSPGIRTEDHDRLIEQWIDVFEMPQDEHGTWIFDRQQSKLWEAYNDLLKRHRALVGRWNKFVTQYNATVNPRPIGRPLAASQTQQAEVLKRRKAGASLREIAAAMSLSVRTVRSILAKKQHVNKLRRMEFERLRAAAYRARLKSRERLPQLITEQLKNGATLVKTAKGLGR